tara:strand:+ start:519 stop:737 length:219 start_codon:yes stop_codon:yes gene_type:complete
MAKEYRTVKVHTEELQEILGTKSFVVEIEREVSVVVNADSKEQAEEHAMDLFVENPNEELLLNRVVGVTEEE